MLMRVAVLVHRSGGRISAAAGPGQLSLRSACSHFPDIFSSFLCYRTMPKTNRKRIEDSDPSQSRFRSSSRRLSEETA